MSIEWKETTLGDHINFRNGKSSPERGDNLLHPVYGSNGVIGRACSTNTKDKAIVIGRVGSFCGSLYFSKSPAWVTDNAIIAEAKDDNDLLFFYYLLTNQNLNHLKAGSGQPLINQSILSSIKVTTPAPCEQIAIASILGALDDKIELNRRTNATLEAMARALFKSWFVDFDPVRAKMEGKKPFGMDSATAALFPSRLTQSELGDIPEGWKVALLSEVTNELRRGVSPRYVSDGGICVLNQKCIRDQIVSFADARQHDCISKPVAGRELKSGDVLVNSTGVGTLGRVAQIWQMDAPTIVDSHVTIVRANLEVMPPIYLGLNLMERQAEIEGLGEGSTGQTELSRVQLGKLQILVPSLLLLKNFEDSLIPLKNKITSTQKECGELASMRDYLLPKLISGDIRIRDAEKFVEAA